MNAPVLMPANPALGLYDSGTGKSVVAYKMIDLTHLCTDSKRCVIKYADVERGRIAQICDWYEANEDIGVTVHYFINEMTPDQLKRDVVFVQRCRVMGANMTEMVYEIFSNQH